MIVKSVVFAANDLSAIFDIRFMYNVRKRRPHMLVFNYVRYVIRQSMANEGKVCAV